MYTYKANVVRVIDGDTLDLKIDVGFGMDMQIRGRLLNVDTPERGDPAWSTATTIFSQLLNDQKDENGQIVVRTFKTGKYGRWLVDIDGVNSTLAETWPYE